uniref:BACK domain-containing protein n=1 Tax=Ciona savignyi TaxID=51511 RepID=H2YMN4_CIOSA
EKQEIELSGISPEIMTSLLNYAYTGQVIITSQNVEELLPAADKFLVDYVKQKCCAFLKKQLTPLNCIGIRQYARSFFCPKLVEAAHNFILYNFEEVIQKSPEYLMMNFNDVHQLISDDRLNVRLEETVCEAVFRWIRHDKMGRISNLCVLLKGVRMGLLDPEYFMTKLKGCELVTESMGECRGLIKDAMKRYYRLVFSQITVLGKSITQPARLKISKPKMPSQPAISATATRCDISSPRKHSFEPQMLHKRCYISVAVLHNKIYALGGMNGSDRLNSAESYDPVHKIWTILPDMNESRSDSSATSLNGRVYIAGGFNGQECLFTAEFYDPGTSVWTRITPMRSRRSGVSIVSFHSMVYAVGGFDGVNRLRHAEAYCPRTNTWRNIASMNKPRSNFGIEVIDDQLLVVGGYNGHQTSWDVEAYDDTANEW